VKRFVFITHKTPQAKQSVLRKKLYDLYLRSLNEQTYLNWKVLIIGEEESENGKFKTVKIDQGAGTEFGAKLVEIYARKDVRDFIETSDYLVKLDDDDIISPFILEKVADKEFDIYFDEWHTFYDVTSGQITQQKRNWIASTCIHKTQHALAPINNTAKNYYSNSVLYSDHSKVWHSYYANKTKLIAEKKDPVYLRVLSPTSITAGAKKIPLRTVNDVDLNEYYLYLRSFGDWNVSNTTHFDRFRQELTLAWSEFSGRSQKEIPKIGGLKKLKDKATNYGKAIRRIFR
jgi:hypothetical protein